MTRASIACVECRRSKTKCHNNGAGTVCKTCAAKNKQCTYLDGVPSSATSGSSRRESTLGEVDVPSKKRKRPLAPTASAVHRSKDGLGPYEDALDSPLLTPRVWEQLFEIYEKHFAVDFPFFHKLKFLEPLQQNSGQRAADEKSNTLTVLRPPHSRALLLAFLTQTTRFHPDFVCQSTAPHRDKALEIARYYAEATRVQLGLDNITLPTLEKIQTLLLLGYHEWTDVTTNVNGFLKVREAISSAQVLSLHHDEDKDKKTRMAVNSCVWEKERSVEKQEFIDREIQRRTFWACFLMDRYLCWGKNRIQVLRVEDIETQLVCSDKAFNRGIKTKARFLGELDDAYNDRIREFQPTRSIIHHEERNGGGAHARADNVIYEVKWEVGKDEEALGWYIQLVDHLGAILKWSCAGGRRQDGSKAPFKTDSKFYPLNEKFLRLKSELPEDLRSTPDNNRWHIISKTAVSTKYVNIHAICTLCTVALYREYLPFSALNSKGPQGPLDEPLITEQPDDPEFWNKQAKACFKACKDFADLLNICNLHDKSVETPVIAFAAYTVGWCAVWCYYFPHYDLDNALDTRGKDNAWDIVHSFLWRMASRFKMARGWMGYLKRLRFRYDDIIREYKAVNGHLPGASPQSTNSEGGGGLKDYAEFEESHKAFGKMGLEGNDYADEDIDNVKLGGDQDVDEQTDAASPISTLKNEKRGMSEDVPASTPMSTGSFTAINLNAPANAKTGNNYVTNQQPNPHEPSPVTRNVRQPTSHNSYPHHQPGSGSIPMNQATYHNNPQAYQLVEPGARDHQSSQYMYGSTSMMSRQMNVSSVTMGPADAEAARYHMEQMYDRQPIDSSDFGGLSVMDLSPIQPSYMAESNAGQAQWFHQPPMQYNHNGYYPSNL